MEELLQVVMPEKTNEDSNAEGPEQEEQEECDECGNENQNATSPNNSEKWIMSGLGKNHPDESTEASEEIGGVPVNLNKKMDAATTVAMFEAAGVGQSGQRVMRKHPRDCFGHKFCVPEAETAKFIGAATPPTMDECTHQEKKFEF